MFAKIDKQVAFNIVMLIIVSLLVYLYFQNQKECFEGIAGTSFVSRVPKGTIVAYNKAQAPAGWAICDGESGTPDLRGRFIIGSNPVCNANKDNCNQNMFTFSLNQNGGKYNQKLVKSNIPKHTHTTSLTGYKGNGSSKGLQGYDSNEGWRVWQYTSDGGDVGKGDNDVDPVDIMPPYYSLVYIMKL